MKAKHIQHLYRRIGFGILPTELEKLSKKRKKDVVNSLFKASKSMTLLEVDTSEIKDIFSGMMNASKRDSETLRKIQKISRKKQIELNAAWINRLTKSPEVLREKMTLFWANHFVCEDNSIIYIQQFNNTLRKYALGDFRDFVNAVSKEAAMTKYLNTKQNRKQKPNENFARELMELFTLGVGHYSEEDIKESAKAFTGYSHNLRGEFVFKQRAHDEGEKTFFGKTGNFSGEDIIDIILEQKQCAKYICEKIYRYFVNDVSDKNHINAMTEVFYKDYNIENLMRFVLQSNWFYEDNNVGTKIKSPIEFLVGMKTMVPTEFKEPKQLLYIQKLLGQILLNPPNVAGWKGGRNWIDSNTIVLRLKLPSLLLNDAYISKVKDGHEDAQIDAKKAMFNKKFGKRFKTEVNWKYFNNQFQNVGINDFQNHLLACDVNDSAKAYLQSLEKVSKQEYCIQLMSLPEYQMC
ncbi:MAG: DUF1800 domain-containing protein [Algibacter sp.]|uniref:DUF1800 domain-containing protein n=1 Tax=Algibacter sp. TaxID=1872428 RepID=UPI002623E680|nr:DUF1800 domain-containing protein [Algibacter sp.]MDG1730777.1 DUF1800 domain-containing protein [Algibacter sp.]MDG2177354.1 DUF1800 domain-containing protein [Algibacter sp.]